MRLEPARRLLTVPRWAAGIVGVYLVAVGLHTRLSTDAAPLCPFRRLTGLPCPGCGTTRMVVAALHGEFGQALALNPLFFLAAVGGCVLLLLRLVFGRRVVWITSRRSDIRMAAVALLAVLGNWAYLLVRFAFEHVGNVGP